MKRVKVLHVLDSAGGVRVYLNLILQHIDPNKIDNVIIQQVTDQEYYNNRSEKIKTYQTPIQREISIVKDIKAVIQTVKIFKKEKPSIVHAHSAKAGVIARVASIFYKVRVLHTPHAYSYLSTDSKIKRFFYLLIERFLKNFNSYCLATSNSERDRALKDVKYKKEKVLLFNNSVKPMLPLKETFEGKYDLPSKFLCTIGRPSYQKNTEMIIEVIRALKNDIPDIHMVILGVGGYSPNKEKINNLIDQYQLSSNVTMMDWVDRSEALYIVSKSLLYISTSRYEGLPYAVIESLALKKACVVTNCDGNIDLVKEGFNGYLIEQNDIAEMVSKIKELYSNTDLRQKFENNSLGLFNQSFNIENNISLLEEIYIEYGKK